MIKIIAVGLWVCIVSLGSSFAVASLQGPAAAPAEADAEATPFHGLEYRRTEPISIPMISDTRLEGYVLASFVYTIDGKTAAELKVPPDPFVTDSAFRRVYSLDGFTFEDPKRFDLKALTASIKADVNAVFKQDVVAEVLVDKFDYIPSSEIRGGAEKTSVLEH